MAWLKYAKPRMFLSWPLFRSIVSVRHCKQGYRKTLVNSDGESIKRKKNGEGELETKNRSMTFFFFFLVALGHLGNRKKIRQERRKPLLLLGIRKISSISKQTTFFSTQISSPPQPQAVKFNMQLDPQSTWLCKALPFTRFPFQNVSGECDKFGPVAAHHACQLSGSVHCSSHPRALLILLQLPTSSSEGLTPGSCCWLRTPAPSVFSLLSFPLHSHGCRENLQF